MKKIIAAVLIGLMAFVVFATVGFAQTADVPVVEPEVAPGITPDSFFYFIDKWLDNQKILRATSAVEKARLRIEIAEERVAEMRAMLLLGKTAEAKEAQEDEEKHIGELETDLEEVDDEIEKELEVETEVEVEKEKTKVRLDIQEKLQKHILVLMRVQGQVPEQAQQGIETALENAQKHFEALQQQIPAEDRKTVNEIRTEIMENGVRIREKIEIKDGKSKFEFRVQDATNTGKSEKSGSSEKSESSGKGGRDGKDSDSSGSGKSGSGSGSSGSSGSGSGSSGSGSGSSNGGNGGD